VQKLDVPPDVIDLTLWSSPEPEEIEAPTGAAAALAFIAFLSFAFGAAAAALVFL
jgi:hypothetical protein